MTDYRAIGDQRCRDRGQQTQGRSFDWAMGDDAIRVEVGTARFVFPAGTPQATIDKLVKKASAITGRKECAKLAKRPGIPNYGKSMTVPSKLMLDAAARGQVARHWEDSYSHSERRDGLMIVHDDTALHAAMIAKARRALAKWDDSDPRYTQFMARIASGKLQELDTAHLERIVASNMRPGARMSGIFAASMLYALEELERRGIKVAA